MTNVDVSWFRPMRTVFGEQLTIVRMANSDLVDFILRVEDREFIHRANLADPNAYQQAYLAVSNARQELIALNNAARRLLS